jgi:hypothetical protein
MHRIKRWNAITTICGKIARPSLHEAVDGSNDADAALRISGSSIRLKAKAEVNDVSMMGALTTRHAFEQGFPLAAT